MTSPIGSDPSISAAPLNNVDASLDSNLDPRVQELFRSLQHLSKQIEQCDERSARHLSQVKEMIEDQKLASEQQKEVSRFLSESLSRQKQDLDRLAQNLERSHEQALSTIKETGDRIDRVYFSNRALCQRMKKQEEVVRKIGQTYRDILGIGAEAFVIHIQTENMRRELEDNAFAKRLSRVCSSSISYPARLLRQGVQRFRGSEEAWSETTSFPASNRLLLEAPREPSSEKKSLDAVD